MTAKPTSRTTGKGNARFWARGLLVLAPVLLGGCGSGVLDPQGPVGVANRMILIGSLVIMLAIVVPTIVAILGFGWWFRESNTRATYRPNFVYSGQIELITWSIPLLTIILLGGVAWVGSHELDPAKPLVSEHKPLEVQVVSMDWKWLFVYPEQKIASVNKLVIPTGVPVHFALTSASVMSVFFVPQLGSMIYTMNGMATEVNLQADAAGTFRGQSSHFNGDGFSDMHFDVEAVPAARFDAWAAAARDGGPRLDAGSYEELAKQSLVKQPFTYQDIDPEVFDRVVSQALPPGPGPQAGLPDRTVSSRTGQSDVR